MDLNLDECLEPFTAYLKQKGKSPNTIRSYLCAIRLYASLYSRLNPANLRAYRAHLLAHYRINTVNARIYAVNCFLDSLRFSPGTGQTAAMYLSGLRHLPERLRKAEAPSPAGSQFLLVFCRPLSGGYRRQNQRAASD